LDRLNATAPTGGDGGDAVAPSLRLYFAPEVHHACVGRDAVLLDVRGDGYHCLPDGASLCRRLAQGRRVPITGAVKALIGAGLIGAEPSSPLPAPPSRPIRSVIHRPRRLDLLRDLGPALGAVREVRAARRGASLSPYVTLGGVEPRDDAEAAIEAGRRFWALMPYLPIEGECLVRSAMLIRFLRRHGLRADWVFGVRLCPFTAHCWVQVEDVCLNDDVERLVAYTPIMVR
jgi:hypothetical protein